MKAGFNIPITTSLASGGLSDKHVQPNLNLYHSFIREKLETTRKWFDANWGNYVPLQSTSVFSAANILVFLNTGLTLHIVAFLNISKCKYYYF